jgi:hypothetical protein
LVGALLRWLLSTKQAFLAWPRQRSLSHFKFQRTAWPCHRPAFVLTPRTMLPHGVAKPQDSHLPSFGTSLVRGSLLCASDARAKQHKWLEALQGGGQRHTFSTPPSGALHVEQSCFWAAVAAVRFLLTLLLLLLLFMLSSLFSLSTLRLFSLPVWPSSSLSSSSSSSSSCPPVESSSPRSGHSEIGPT